MSVLRGAAVFISSFVGRPLRGARALVIRSGVEGPSRARVEDGRGELWCRLPSSLAEWLELTLSNAAFVDARYARMLEYHDRAALEELLRDARGVLVGMALADEGCSVSAAFARRIVAAADDESVLVLASSLLLRRSSSPGVAPAWAGGYRKWKESHEG